MTVVPSFRPCTTFLLRNTASCWETAEPSTLQLVDVLRSFAQQLQNLNPHRMSQGFEKIRFKLLYALIHTLYPFIQTFEYIKIIT